MRRVYTELAVIGWMGKLTVDSIDPSCFGRLPSDSDVKPGTKAVTVCTSTMQDKGRSVVGSGDMHRVWQL